VSGEIPGPVAMALVHYPVRDRLGGTQATSVTPLNVHDLARSATTFGVAPVYVITPIISQQELVGRILRHWLEGYGGEQNPSRRESLGLVSLLSSVNEAVDDIFRRTGSYPRIVGTGARGSAGSIGYDDLAGRMAASTRPWLILFGTGSGLTAGVLEQCDLLLDPIGGTGEFNHLSVRGAVAIILDRLFGK
jgi:hypothetical protein